MKTILFLLALLPTQAHALCLKSSYSVDFAGAMNNNFKYLACLHDESVETINQHAELINQQAQLLNEQSSTISDLEGDVRRLQSLEDDVRRLKSSLSDAERKIAELSSR